MYNRILILSIKNITNEKIIQYNGPKSPGHTPSATPLQSAASLAQYGDRACRNHQFHSNILHSTKSPKARSSGCLRHGSTLGAPPRLKYITGVSAAIL